MLNCIDMYRALHRSFWIVLSVGLGLLSKGDLAAERSRSTTWVFCGLFEPKHAKTYLKVSWRAEIFGGYLL